MNLRSLERTIPARRNDVSVCPSPNSRVDRRSRALQLIRDPLHGSLRRIGKRCPFRYSNCADKQPAWRIFANARAYGVNAERKQREKMPAANTESPLIVEMYEVTGHRGPSSGGAFYLLLSIGKPGSAIRVARGCGSEGPLETDSPCWQRDGPLILLIFSSLPPTPLIPLTPPALTFKNPVAPSFSSSSIDL